MNFSESVKVFVLHENVCCNYHGDMADFPQPNLVHRLPPAPHFVGREAELAALRQLWGTGFAGVVALVGLGGAGKLLARIQGEG